MYLIEVTFEGMLILKLSFYWDCSSHSLQAFTAIFLFSHVLQRSWLNSYPMPRHILQNRLKSVTWSL